MPEAKKLLIAGAGGWGLEAIWIAQAMSAAQTAHWDIIGFSDDQRSARGTEHSGFPILCSTDEIFAFCGGDTHVFVAVGDNRTRRKIVGSIARQGLRFATLIHPHAIISDGVDVGDGSYIGPFATLAPRCEIGAHVLVNIHAVIGHEAIIGDYSQLAPGAVVTGQCRLGEGTFVGSNASLYPGRRLSDYSVVAANSFVVTDLDEGQTVMGIPAKPVFKRR